MVAVLREASQSASIPLSPCFSARRGCHLVISYLDAAGAATSGWSHHRWLAAQRRFDLVIRDYGSMHENELRL